MTSVLESVADVVNSFMDEEPKTPLHIGEVMNCWTYLTMLEEEKANVQIGINTTTDQDLLDALHSSMQLAEQQSKELRDFMLREGVPLPAASEMKPISDPNAVPMGVKLTDHEIANALSIKVVANYMMCATGTIQSIRNDVGLMFAKFQEQKLKFGIRLKMLTRKRGWLKVPPYYLPNGSPHST